MEAEYNLHRQIGAKPLSRMVMADNAHPQGDSHVLTLEINLSIWFCFRYYHVMVDLLNETEIDVVDTNPDIKNQLIIYS